jgi:CheY-like chemotaxis protein
MCLFSNAIKYSSGGSVVVRCFLTENKTDPKPNLDDVEIVSDSEDGRSICVEVEDSGIGITLEKRLMLFSPFQQAQRMATGGTGLGLYSLRKRIDSLGGDCGIKDRHDRKQGTLFWFTFPYRPDEYSAQITDSGSRTPATSGYVTPAYSLYSSGASSPIPVHVRVRRDSGASTPSNTIKAKLIGLIGEAADKINMDRITYQTHLHSKVSNSLQPGNLLRNSFDNSSLLLNFSTHPPSNSQSSLGSPRKAPSALIVDDSMSILKMCRRALERIGFNVIIAENGALALAILTEKHREFDVMLTDLQMPIMGKSKIELGN